MVISLTLGIARKFVLRSLNYRSRKTIKYQLIPQVRSLLIMDRDCITAKYEHTVPKTVKIDQARINLTFRT